MHYNVPIIVFYMYSHVSILAHVLEYIGIVLIKCIHYFSTVAFLKAEYINIDICPRTLSLLFYVQGHNI